MFFVLKKYVINLSWEMKTYSRNYGNAGHNAFIIVGGCKQEENFLLQFS